MKTLNKIRKVLKGDKYFYMLESFEIFNFVIIFSKMSEMECDLIYAKKPFRIVLWLDNKRLGTEKKLFGFSF